jgi:hypothetical protein
MKVSSKLLNFQNLRKKLLTNQGFHVKISALFRCSDSDQTYSTFLREFKSFSDKVLSKFLNFQTQICEFLDSLEIQDFSFKITTFQLLPRQNLEFFRKLQNF